MKRCCSPNRGRRPTSIRSLPAPPFSARMMVVFRTGWKLRFKLLSAAMQTLRTLDALEREGLLTPDPRLAAAAQSMAIAITPEMLALIDRDDPAHDPIARQFVPSAAETELSPDELLDPIGDEARSPLPGIVHRYPDRVLLKPLLVCPVYCRFCFRREQVGKGEGLLSPAALDAAISYITEHDEIWEVIVTGGDPLVLSPRRIRALVRRLSGIPHVAVIRFHTRV